MNDRRGRELGPSRGGARNWPRAVAALVGLGDALTGLGLVVAPVTLVGLMGIQTDSTPQVWLRFIGAFVLGVGLATLEPALTAAATRLPGATSATITIRLVVAGVVGLAVARAELEPRWLLVTCWDVVAALAQAVSWRRSSHG